MEFKIKIKKKEWSFFAMITGKHYSNEEIAKLEAQYLDKFYKSDNQDPKLTDGADYYAILFQTFLHKNKDRVFEKMKEEEQSNIFKGQDTKFRRAMQYSFNKGHQTAFAIILMDSKNAQEFNETFFSNPNSKLVFIYNLEKMIEPGIIEENLRRDKNEILIRETRRHFEHGYEKIMYLAKIFFKKGAEIAFDQIRQDVVHSKYNIRGYTRMLELPYNQDIEVTPAFTATFSLESPGYEEWDLHWDATYGYEVSKRLIAKFMVHQFSIKEIKAFSAVGAITYKMLEDYFSDKLDDNEIVYLGEINFALTTPFKGMRFIEHSEYKAIQTSLALTLSRRLKISSNHILVTI